MDISNKIADIVRDAGEIMLSAVDAQSTVTEKSGVANYVTKYDVAVEDFLYEKLAKLLPDAIFIGEESDANHSELLAKGLSFIIDPIDGTTNFIHDYRHSAISVGLCDKGEMISGVVYDPYLGEVFAADKGRGAYLNGRRIEVSDRTLSESVVAFGTTPYTRSYTEWSFGYAMRLYSASNDIRRSGSAALDLCNVACGRVDAFFEGSLSPWDYAAGSVIITEAGGIITALDGSKVRLDTVCSILAGNRSTHAEARVIYDSYPLMVK